MATVAATAAAAWEHEAAAGAVVGAVATVQSQRATWVGLTTQQAAGEERALSLAASAVLLAAAEEAATVLVAEVQEGATATVAAVAAVAVGRE